jgi:hypothetical protein
MDENERSGVERIGSSRRRILKLAGTSTSALVLPGLASAKGDPGKKSQKGRKQSVSRKSRAEKAAEEGKEWDESWIDQDRVGESWVDVETKHTDTVISTQADGRHIGGTFGVEGITVTLDGYLGECDGWAEIGALGQSQRLEFTCPNACSSFSRDAGGAYIDVNCCVNWDELILNVNIEGCIWHVTDWSCTTIEVEL